MRISQRTMYYDYINNMNSTLSAYMESNMQGASQKQVNRPSDDPVGTARILMYRSSLSDISQFQRNLSTAEGWLKETDYTLSLGDSGVTSLLSKIKVQAEEGATSTQSAENRLQIARQVRELFGSLLNLSNQRFEGKSLFCGQNYNSTSFEEGLAADCTSPDFQADLEAARNPAPPAQPQWITFSHNTLNDQTAVIRFTSAGTTGTDPLAYQYTKDGGKTWVQGTLPVAPADCTIDLNGTVMTIPQGVRIPAFDATNTAGTQIVVRPTAVYQSMDNNSVPQIVTKQMSGATITTNGSFATDIQVRIDTDIMGNWDTPGEDFSYSYSTDGGLSWTQRQGNTSDTRLLVPGGFVQITGATGCRAGAELTVKPQRTDLTMQADFDYKALVNNVGKDVFGGLYTSLDEYGRKVQLTAFDGEGKNVFETVGKLIGALETNNQDGVQQALDNLTESLNHITAYAARIGARRNALAVTQESLTTQKNGQQEAMSHIEDIDLTTLLTKMTQQQLAYSTVLKSSSMIMQLNLAQYI